MTAEIVVVAHQGTLGMELLGVCDLFETANWALLESGRSAAYNVRLAGVDERTLRMWGHGITVGCDGALAEIDGDIDTLVVVGGPVAREASKHPKSVAQIVAAAARSARVVGVCTGAFFLAQAGLLDGRRCTTHWDWCDDFSIRFPFAKLDRDAPFVRDGRTWTSAGVTAGFDMLLSLITEDVGVEVARMVARRLVLYLARSGTQAQFHEPRDVVVNRRKLRVLQDYIDAHLRSDLSITALAEEANTSPRHLSRLFTCELGMAPAKYVERTRLTEARRLLEDTDDPVETVARKSGFTAYRNLHRSFAATYGVPPAEYRRRFGSIVKVTAGQRGPLPT